MASAQAVILSLYPVNWFALDKYMHKMEGKNPGNQKPNQSKQATHITYKKIPNKSLKPKHFKN